MAIVVPDAERFAWKVETICQVCGEVEGVTTGKMVVIGDNVYPMNLHADTSRIAGHVCEGPPS